MCSGNFAGSGNNIVMSNSLDQKVKKLYAARSKREAELHAIHEDILH